MQRTILGSVACLVLFLLIVGGLHLFIDPVLAEGTAATFARNALHCRVKGAIQAVSDELKK